MRAPSSARCGLFVRAVARRSCLRARCSSEAGRAAPADRAGTSAVGVAVVTTVTATTAITTTVTATVAITTTATATDAAGTAGRRGADAGTPRGE
jgi:hypothetical protein